MSHHRFIFHLQVSSLFSIYRKVTVGRDEWDLSYIGTYIFECTLALYLLLNKLDSGFKQDFLEISEPSTMEREDYFHPEKHEKLELHALKSYYYSDLIDSSWVQGGEVAHSPAWLQAW